MIDTKPTTAQPDGGFRRSAGAAHATTPRTAVEAQGSDWDTNAHTLASAVDTAATRTCTRREHEATPPSKGTEMDALFLLPVVVVGMFAGVLLARPLATLIYRLRGKGKTLPY